MTMLAHVAEWRNGSKRDKRELASGEPLVFGSTTEIAAPLVK